MGITEFIRSRGLEKRFHIRCRYLKSNKRIDKKLVRTRIHSNLMITRELIYINSKFQMDIQDVDFLPMLIANMESQYSWPTIEQTERMSAQAMAIE